MNTFHQKTSRYTGNFSHLLFLYQAGFLWCGWPRVELGWSIQTETPILSDLKFLALIRILFCYGFYKRYSLRVTKLSIYLLIRIMISALICSPTFLFIRLSIYQKANQQSLYKVMLFYNSLG